MKPKYSRLLLKLVALLLLIVHASAQKIETPGVDPISARVMPKPKNYTYGTENYQIDDPCVIQYYPSSSSGQIPYHIWEIIDFYAQKTFELESLQSCFFPKTYRGKSRVTLENKITFDIQISNTTLKIADKVADEQYKLKIYNASYWELKVDTYVGLLRGLETFSQLFVLNEDVDVWVLKDAPIIIKDIPDFAHRGLMIDTARHFLSVEAILKTIDSMLFNKLNVLHWHITDEQSFPFQLKSFPNITKYGAYSKSKIYSLEEIKLIIEQALFKGIQVIPEVDSPAHSLSWGKSEQFKEIAMSCQTYRGQLDPTLNLTYVAAKGIMEDMNDQFYTSKYVHLGGDEVNQTCWDQRPQIQEWMNQNNISSYSDLEVYFRRTQKSIWKTINATKPAIYWADTAITVDSDDIIQWWGTSASLSLIANYTNKIILSNYDQTYLDVGNILNDFITFLHLLYGGSGTTKGTPYGTFQSWGQMSTFDPVITGIKGEVIGGESCIWSEMSNEQTHFLRIWTRNSVFSEKLWNRNATSTDTYNTRAMVSRMVYMQKRLNKRGIEASPVTVEICEMNLALCYDN